MSDISTYALTLAYNGAAFAGFARQKDAGISTVQEALETALATALRLSEPPATVGAGRTDAGVHALGQVVSFELPRLLRSGSELVSEFSAKSGKAQSALSELELAQLVRSLNALTPDAITVLGLRPVPHGFSARFDARAREYRYRICNRPSPPIFNRDFAWHIAAPLNVAAMREAATHLMGERDFRSFCATASACDDKNTIRTLTTLDITTEESIGEPLLTIRVVGNAFLHNMVRIIVGTLVEVGHGKRNPGSISTVLDALTRSAAGQTAPAHGLTFHCVDYAYLL